MIKSIDNTIKKQFILGYIAENLPLRDLWPPGEQDGINSNIVDGLIKKANFVYERVMNHEDKQG